MESAVGILNTLTVLRTKCPWIQQYLSLSQANICDTKYTLWSLIEVGAFRREPWILIFLQFDVICNWPRFIFIACAIWILRWCQEIEETPPWCAWISSLLHFLKYCYSYVLKICKQVPYSAKCHVYLCIIGTVTESLDIAKLWQGALYPCVQRWLGCTMRPNSLFKTWFGSPYDYK